MEESRDGRDETCARFWEIVKNMGRKYSFYPSTAHRPPTCLGRLFRITLAVIAPQNTSSNYALLAFKPFHLHLLALFSSRTS